MTGLHSSWATQGPNELAGIGVKMEACDGTAVFPARVAIDTRPLCLPQASSHVFGVGTDNPTFGEPALASSLSYLLTL